jgi:hypothetical protein
MRVSTMKIQEIHSSTVLSIPQREQRNPRNCFPRTLKNTYSVYVYSMNESQFPFWFVVRSSFSTRSETFLHTMKIQEIQ